MLSEQQGRSEWWDAIRTSPLGRWVIQPTELLVIFNKSFLAPHSVQRYRRGANPKEAGLSLRKGMVHEVEDDWYVQSVPRNVQTSFDVGSFYLLQLLPSLLFLLCLAGAGLLHDGWLHIESIRAVRDILECLRVTRAGSGGVAYLPTSPQCPE